MRFELFAPRNPFVALRCSADRDRERPMRRDDDGWWRCELDLGDGEHAYDFVVEPPGGGDRIVVGDPRARRLGADRRAVVAIEGGRATDDGYAWRHDDVALPQNRDLVIYELQVSDFAGREGGGGRFVDVIDRLDHLRDLGVNALELLPVTGAGPEPSWGYLVQHYFAVEPRYGTSADLKRLVDECHARGMRVICDVVFNHASTECPLVAIDRDYWFHREPKDPEHWWGPEFDFDRRDPELDLRPAWRFVEDCLAYWVTVFHLDGLRYDAARQLADRELMRHLAQRARELAGPKPFINIAEYVPPTPEIAGHDAPMDATWRASFRGAVVEPLLCRGFERERMEAAIDPRRDGFTSATDVVHYLSSHDWDHLLAELGSAGVTGEDAVRRARLGHALLFTAMGLPLLWMGEEYGDDQGKDLDPVPLRWDLLERNPLHQSLHAAVRDLVALRRSRPALRGDEVDLVHRDARDRTLCYVRRGQGGDVLVVANCGPRGYERYDVNGVPEADWRRWPGDEPVDVRAGRLRLALEPYAVEIMLAQEGQEDR